MSYSLYIGEAICDDYDDYGALRGTVCRMTHPDAPLYPGDAMTGQTNGRHPGYVQWHAFTQRVGLEALFYDKESGILRAHPGIVRVTTHMVTMCEQAVARLQAPGKKPGWCTCKTCDPASWLKQRRQWHDPSLDGDLASCEWLVWWMRYALAHCAIPAISNS